MNILLNVIAFKIAWVASVLAGANDMPALAISAVGGAIALHLWLACEPAREIALIVLCGLVGLAWDSVIVAAGWVGYPSGTVVPGLAPYWIVLMWLAFATTLNVSFRALRARPAMAALLGAVFGPLSYVAGAAFGAVDLEHATMALGSLSLAWAVLMPGLVITAAQLDGQPPAVRGNAA